VVDLAYTDIFSNGDRLFFSLSDRFNLRSALAQPEKYIVFDWKKGISYDIDESVYRLLEKCDGSRDLTALQKIFPKKELHAHLRHLLDEGIISVLQDKSSGFMENQVATPYQGDFLRRIHWHLTCRCNLRCQHCYVSSSINKGELSYTDITTLIGQMARMTVTYVSLSGGEVFLREDFPQILTELHDHRMGIKNINTNATIVDKSIVKQIHDFYPDTPFFVSIDGGTPESHDKFRDCPGAFAATLGGIKTLLENGVRVLINTSLWSGNAHEISEIYHLIKSLGIAKWRVSQPFPMGRWACTKVSDSVPIQKELEIYEDILDLWEEDNLPFEIELGSAFRIQFEPYEMERYVPESYICGYYRDSCSILPNGDVIPCGALTDKNFICGNIKERSLDAVWQSHNMRFFKNLTIGDCLSDPKNDCCRSCEWLYYCGMGCRVRSVHFAGDLKHYDPVLCKYYKDQEVFKRFKSVYLRHAKKYEKEIT
jgi:radical SAM protein with 4Fe4S-binding SPASM domain